VVTPARPLSLLLSFMLTSAHLLPADSKSGRDEEEEEEEEEEK
jgi:hypothetical protein